MDPYILIPAYNEADHISAVVKTASRFLPVLVVDDGSQDETVLLAEAAGATVLRQIPNQGKGAALRRGFQYSIEHDAPAVITLDADGQHDPEEIPLFMEKFAQQGCDLIIGERDFHKMPFTRKVANSLGKKVISWALSRDVPDNQSGYRLISKRLMQRMLSSSESGFEFEVEMVAEAIARGYIIAGVPIRTIYADEKSHIRPLQHIKNFFGIALKARRMLKQAREESNA